MSTFLNESLLIVLDCIGKNKWLNPIKSYLIRNRNKSQTYKFTLLTLYILDFSKSALPRPSRNLVIDIAILPLIVSVRNE